MDPGGRAVRGEPPGEVAQRARAGIAVEDEQGVRAFVRGGGQPDPLGIGGGPVRAEGTVVQPPGQFARACGGLIAVVREEQPAVLAVRGPYVGQPAEPAPVAAAVGEAACAVGGQQHDLQLPGRVQCGELRDQPAGDPGQPGPRAGHAEPADLGQ